MLRCAFVFLALAIASSLAALAGGWHFAWAVFDGSLFLGCLALLLEVMSRARERAGSLESRDRARELATR